MSDKRAPVFIWGCWKLIRMLFWLTCCPPIHFDPNTFDKELTQQVIQGRPLEDSVSIIYITLKRSSYILICVMNEYIRQNIFWLRIPNIANHLYICHPKQFSPFFHLGAAWCLFLCSRGPQPTCSSTSNWGGQPVYLMPGPDLIFVTDITDYIRGEKSVMWRNFRFL